MTSRPAHRAYLPAAALLALAILVAAACGNVAGWPAPPPRPVLVGVDLNLTGRSEHPGIVFHNALRLQVEQVSGEQEPTRRLELRVLDNRGDAESSRRNLAELAADPDVAAVITAGCPACVIELADQLRVPVISLDPVEAVAAPAPERQWTFRLGPNAADNADVLSLAMAQAGVETIGMISADDAYGEEGLLWIQEAALRDGLAVVTHHRVDEGDQTAIAAAAEAIAGWQPPPDPDVGFDPLPPNDQVSGPDAVVLWLYPPAAGPAAVALRNAGYAGRMFADMVAADELFLSGDTAALTGASLVFTATPVADQRIASSPALAARQAWVLAYTARYGTYHLHSSFAADALLVIADAVDRADRPDREPLRDRLESTRIDGLTGQIRFTGDQHSGLTSGALLTLTASGDRWQ